MATFIGTAANDQLTGTSGDDVLEGKGGADKLNGGAGEDSTSHEHSPSGLNIYLIAGGPSSGEAAGDRYTSIENVIGSYYDDGIYGDAGPNKLYGLSGRDTLYGWGGGDSLFGGDDTDNLVGSSGFDFIDGGNGIDTLSYQLSPTGLTVSMANPAVNTGWAAGDQYVNVEDCTGTEYDDVIYGDDQAVNNLMGLAGNDRIYGGGGYDVMIGGAGADFLDGGAGKDELDYEEAPMGLTASLFNPSINTGYAAGDTYVNIEDIAGSAFADILQGDMNNNDMIGLEGNDIMYGMGGNDAIQGREGDDTLIGDDDWDLLVGGTGNDTAVFSRSIADYTITQTGSNFTVGTTLGNEGTDTLVEMEYVKFSDATIRLTLLPSAVPVRTAHTDTSQKNYIAFFNRPGDASGLAYWEGQLASGVSEAQTQNGFSSSAEYQAIYQGKSNEDLINALYHNLFGRAAEADGLAWWANQMATGKQTITSIAGALASGTTAGSPDNLTIMNKITAAVAFSQALNDPGKTEMYGSLSATTKAGSWLNSVTSDAASIDSAVAKLPDLFMTLGASGSVSGSNINLDHVDRPVNVLSFSANQSLKTVSVTGFSGDKIDLYDFNFVGTQAGVTIKAGMSGAQTTSAAGFFAGKGVAIADIGSATHVYADADHDGNFTPGIDVDISLVGAHNVTAANLIL